MNHLIDILQLSTQEIDELVAKANDIIARPEAYAHKCDGKILATAPDLICLVDTETFIPVTTDGLKYGKRVLVVGLKCYPMWRTPKGIELVGPRYFGIDADYIPVEERVKGGAANV